MTTKALEHLTKIVDLLGPNMSLELDQVSFPWFFGINIDAGRDARPAVRAGEEFASQHGCVFGFDEKTRTAKFGAASFRHKFQTPAAERLNP